MQNEGVALEHPNGRFGVKLQRLGEYIKKKSTKNVVSTNQVADGWLAALSSQATALCHSHANADNKLCPPVDIYDSSVLLMLYYKVKYNGRVDNEKKYLPRHDI